MNGNVAYRLGLACLLAAFAACAPGKTPDGPAPPAVIERSLAWTHSELLDDPETLGLGRVMAAFSNDEHGGILLDAWFDRFATTAHSERYGPRLLLEEFRAIHGPDPAAWDLDALPFKATGVHNRIDLMSAEHCGELRVSFASTDPSYAPMHLLFLFRQPAGTNDRAGGTIDCHATARRWAELSGIESEPAFFAAARALLDEALTPERAVMAETLEQTVSPWEWRQWTFLDAAPENPPLFQTVDIARLNAPGQERDDFLAWVESNAPALDARALEIPASWRPPSARVAAGVDRTPLDLTGVDPAVLAAYPDLRKKIEIVGCPVCHTADAEFVQTRPDRSFSPFYEKELEARRIHLDALATGTAPQPPFGPLQDQPILPD